MQSAKSKRLTDSINRMASLSTFIKSLEGCLGAPSITESDLFESEPDTMHEAWAKLSEDERRRNWAMAIAGHQQQRKPEYAPDEMY